MHPCSLDYKLANISCYHWISPSHAKWQYFTPKQNWNDDSENAKVKMGIHKEMEIRDVYILYAFYGKAIKRIKLLPNQNSYLILDKLSWKVVSLASAAPKAQLH